MSLAVLVRQMPGSAKDVNFITLEDETLIANLIVWRSASTKPPHHPGLKHARMPGRQGAAPGRRHSPGRRAPRDLGDDLRTISGLDEPFSARHRTRRRRQTADDSRQPHRKAGLHAPRDMYEPTLHIDTLKVKSRYFREVSVPGYALGGLAVSKRSKWHKPDG